MQATFILKVNSPWFPRHLAGSVLAVSQIQLVTACRF